MHITQGGRIMNVLIAAESATGWETALQRARSLLADADGTVTLLHIIPRATMYGHGLPVDDEWDDLTVEQTRAATLLQMGVRHLREAHVHLRLETRVQVGEPDVLVLRATAEMGAEVIILGTALRSCRARYVQHPPRHRPSRRWARTSPSPPRSDARDGRAKARLRVATMVHTRRHRLANDASTGPDLRAPRTGTARSRGAPAGS